MSSYKQRRAVQARIEKLKLKDFRAIDIGHFDIEDMGEDLEYEDVVAPVGVAHRLKVNRGRWANTVARGCNKNYQDEYIVPRSLVTKSWVPDCTKTGCYPPKKS